MIECPYCKNRALLVDSKEVYSKSYGMIWICTPCQAWVGCHANTKDHKPLGRLANKELRQWKQLAHRSFDPLWRRKADRQGVSKSKARKSGYKWLAKEMGMDARVCHIGMFDVTDCKRVVTVCIGEFKEYIELQCPDCKDLDYTDHSEACEICHGTADYIQDIPVQWTTTKDIYEMMHKTKVRIINADLCENKKESQVRYIGDEYTNEEEIYTGPKADDL